MDLFSGSFNRGVSAHILWYIGTTVHDMNMQIERPRRVERSYVQTLEAEPAAVFPLLCPVREAEWIEEWDPIVVYTDSGLAERDCVFQTADGEETATWVITDYDPERYRLVFAKVTADRLLTVIRIQLDPDNGTTRARVTYSHTALKSEATPFLESFTEEAYRSFMTRWETDLNAYLQGDRSDPQPR